MLRIVTFYSTQLPGPNYHCREVRFWKTLHDLCQYDVLQTPGVVKFIVQLLDSVNFLLKQCFTIRYKCLFQGSKLARLPRPESVVEVLLINFPRGMIYGCGDLIFSSHMIFTLLFVLTYHKYGTIRFIKQSAWLLAIIESLLIIASRKHYTVDVVVAWYTVNLVVFFINKKLPGYCSQLISFQYF